MAQGEPALLTVEEVAAYLRTSPTAVYHQVARGQLPGVVRVGRRVLVRRAVLERALDERTSGRVGK
ncbi:MAG: helix-turn-helix domain-containing protein [Polyangiaceae bacterium]|jgi:excisionase family DNA binding protein